MQRNGYRWARGEVGQEGTPPPEEAFAEWSAP